MSSASRSALPEGLAAHDEGFVDACDGAPLYWRSVGAGPAVVLCDGILCDGYIWRYLLPVLAQRFRVVHWNYRGHGRSGAARDLNRVGIEEQALDAWRVCDALGIERAAFAGHSMGTQVCLECWRARPSHTAGLVLLCGSYGRVTRTFHQSDILSRLLPVVTELVGRRPGLVRAMLSNTPAAIALLVAKAFREVDPLRTRTDDMLPYFEHLRTMDPELFVRMITRAGSHNSEPWLHLIDAPVLLVAGERDTFTPPRLQAQMARQIPNSEHLLVLEGSHSCPIEQPAIVNERVEDFLLHRAHFEATPEAEQSSG